MSRLGLLAAQHGHLVGSCNFRRMASFVFFACALLFLSFSRVRCFFVFFSRVRCFFCFPNTDGRPVLVPPFMMPGNITETHYQNVGGMPATPSQQHYPSMMEHQHHLQQGLSCRPGL